MKEGDIWNDLEDDDDVDVSDADVGAGDAEIAYDVDCGLANSATSALLLKIGVPSESW